MFSLNDLLSQKHYLFRRRTRSIILTILRRVGLCVIVLVFITIFILPYLNRKMFLTTRLRSKYISSISIFIFFTVYFSASSMSIEDLLSNPKERLNATDDELNYIDSLLKLQWAKQLFIRRDDYRISTIIDGFFYQSNRNDATNIKLLKQYDIRHIVSVCNCPPSRVILDNFDVLWINANDDLNTNMRSYFERTNEFLHSARKNKVRVLVHCQVGSSRSSTIVLAYLMK